MLSFPNAKINIGLNIVEKRSDGYHNLESLFYPLKLRDILEITEKVKGFETTFKNTGIQIDAPVNKNLCVKAYNLLSEEFDIPPVQIHLHKVIPFGGGLGGGSADASFTLKSINELFQLNIEEDTLLKFAEQIGSDCPFFIKNTPCYATGKGEILEETPINLSGLHLALINPGFPIGTKDAYAGINPKKSQQLITEIARLPVEEWKNYFKNDFEQSAFRLYPEIEKIKEHLYKKGALYASMTGSGSSVFGLFMTEPNLSEFDKYFVWKEIL